MRRDQRAPHPLALARRRRSVRGLSLVELLLSASLGVVLLGAAVAVLLAAGRMRRNHQLLSDANDEARTALRVVSRALAATGVGGGTYRFMNSSSVPQQRSAVFFTNGTTPLRGTSLPQMPDTLTLMRYGADRRGELVGPLGLSKVYITPDPRQPTTKGVDPLVFRDGESALVTNFQRAVLLPVRGKSPYPYMGLNTVALDIGAVDASALQDGTSTQVQPGASVFPVQIVRYRVVYVPARGPLPERGDLVAELLDPTSLAVINQTVVARDVEDFQVQWAVDNNDDGIADTGFTDDGPTEGRLDPVPAFARISISARTSNFLVSSQGEYVPGGEMTPFEQGLDLGSGGRPKPSGYRRRVLSTVVLLKNLIASRI